MQLISVRLFGLLMLAGLVAFFAGFFSGMHSLTVVGGIVVVLYDVCGILAGLLQPGVPIVLALVGSGVASALGYPWYYGVFWASALFGILGIPEHLARVFRPEPLRPGGDNPPPSESSEGRERLARCTACTAPIFPEDSTCPYCGVNAVAPLAAGAVEHKTASRNVKRRTLGQRALDNPNTAGMIVGAALSLLMITQWDGNKAAVTGVIWGVGVAGLLWFIRLLQGRLNWGCVVPVVTGALYVGMTLFLLEPVVREVFPNVAGTLVVPTSALHAVTSAAPAPTQMPATPVDTIEPTQTPSSTEPPLCVWFFKTQGLRARSFAGVAPFVEWYNKYGQDGLMSPDHGVVQELVMVLEAVLPYQETYLNEWKALGSHSEVREFWSGELKAVELRIEAFSMMIDGFKKDNLDEYYGGYRRWHKAAEFGTKAESAMLLARDRCVKQ